MPKGMILVVTGGGGGGGSFRNTGGVLQYGSKVLVLLCLRLFYLSALVAAVVDLGRKNIAAPAMRPCPFMGKKGVRTQKMGNHNLFFALT